MSKNILLLLLICSICAGISAASAQSLSASNATIDTGETTLILILLDEAPEGLSGYNNLTISLANPDVAVISGVTFPDWATLYENSDLPADSLDIGAVDLMEEIDPGATNIELAQITIQGIAPGESEITLSVEQMDDDSGNQMLPAFQYGVLVVEGEPIATLTPGPGGNGGTSVPTTTATVTGTATAPTTAPTGEATTMPATTPTGEETEEPTATPTEQPGFGALLALAALGAAAVLLTRDR
jgi:PGF-CTERM protein